MSLMMTPKFLAVLTVKREEVPICISVLWWKDWLAGITKTAVLERLSWRCWSIVHFDMSTREAGTQCGKLGGYSWVSSV